jgi:hypothetical protein
MKVAVETPQIEAHRFLLGVRAMSDLRYPSWQEPVRLAVMEIDAQKKEKKITSALRAIDARRAELNGDADHQEERIALDDAVNTLRLVRRMSA